MYFSVVCRNTATLMHRFDQRYKRGETFFFFQNLEIPMNTRYRGLDNKEARVVVIESVELVFFQVPRSRPPDNTPIVYPWSQGKGCYSTMMVMS